MLTVTLAICFVLYYNKTRKRKLFCDITNGSECNMAQVNLKRLKRSELVDIIYQLKKKEQQLEEENAELKRLLEEREVKIENIGSLAEASLALSGIFTAAETAVEIYVQEIRRRHQKLTDEDGESRQN